MRRLSAIIAILLSFSCVQAQLLSRAVLKTQPVFTSIEEAQKNPEQVYRLKLKIKADSLPDAVFQFTNLQELTISKCRLSVLNQRISELTNLEYLDVSANQLVRLPNSLCDLLNLKELIINRNHIEELPEQIGKLTQLTYIDAWDNPLYSLPRSISDLRFSLHELDMRQIELRDEELEAMEKLLPETKIQYTSTCDCHSTRK